MKLVRRTDFNYHSQSHRLVLLIRFTYLLSRFPLQTERLLNYYAKKGVVVIWVHKWILVATNLGEYSNQSEEANLHTIQDDYDERFWLPIAVLWNMAMKLEWLSGLAPLDNGSCLSRSPRLWPNHDQILFLGLSLICLQTLQWVHFLIEQTFRLQLMSEDNLAPLH